MSFKGLIKTAKDGNTESRKAVNMEKEVSLTIKVKLSQRNHWLIEAKKENSNLSREIVKFLTDKYGLPDE